MLSGSSVQLTLVVPGQIPPHLVSCLESKALEVWPMVMVPPGVSWVKKTFSCPFPHDEMWLPDEVVLEEYGLVSRARFSMSTHKPVLMPSKYLPAGQAMQP